MSRLFKMTVLLLAAIFLSGCPIAMAYLRSAGKEENKPRHKIKFAAAAPEGTPWADSLRKAAGEIREGTKGRVRIKFYFGCDSGGEMLEKMKLGQLHALAAEAAALGRIVPEIRVLDLPMLFESRAEAAYVRSKLFGRFAEEFRRKGYVLLGLSDTGFAENKSSGNPTENLHAAAGIVIRRDKFRKLEPKDRETVLEAFRKSSRELVAPLRDDKKKAPEKRGVKESGPPKSGEMKDLGKAARKAWRKHVGNDYSEELLGCVVDLVVECRSMGEEKCREAAGR